MRSFLYSALTFTILFSFSNVSAQFFVGFEKQKISHIEIHIDTTGPITFGSKIPIGFTATDEKGHSYHTKNVPGSGKHAHPDNFTLKVNGGKYVYDHQEAFIIVNSIEENGFNRLGVEIKATNINTKGYSRSSEAFLPLNFQGDRYFSLAGKAGTSGAEGEKGKLGERGTKGSDGSKGPSGALGGNKGHGGKGGNGGAGTNAKNDAGKGSNGGNGGNGLNGENGKDLVVFVNSIMESNGKNTLRVVAVNLSDTTELYDLTNPLTSKVHVFADGGNGGSGGAGGDGGRGGHGGSGGDGGDGGKGGKGKAGMNGGDGGNGGKAANGGSGGQGGNGGNGGDGANGGNGGSVTVYVFDAAINHLDKLVISNKAGGPGLAGSSGGGGNGGSPGLKGKGGNGGSAGYPGITKDDKKGSKGSKGQDGTDGAAGTSGSDGSSGTQGNTGIAGKDGLAPKIIKGTALAEKAMQRYLNQSYKNALIMEMVDILEIETSTAGNE